MLFDHGLAPDRDLRICRVEVLGMLLLFSTSHGEPDRLSLS